MLNVTGIDQFYGESHTLWDVNLHVAKGQCTVLMGRNGVGKTTLLQCIMGLLPIKQGSISLNNREISNDKAEERPYLGVGYVPQGRQIFPMLTVLENLSVGLPVREKSKRTIPDYIYQLFPVLHQMRHRYGGDLSGGQQQQLAIARALVVDPQLLILDEPTEGIQPNIVHEIGDIIQKLNSDYGLTVLLVEQKLPFSRRVGDHFCLLDRGRNVASGAMKDLDQGLITEYLTV